jgi:formate hydrogenlyase transcriptional activator
MELNYFSLPRTKHSDSRLTSNALPRPAEAFETDGDSESSVRAELEREKAHLKLLLELANQTVSSQELRDVVSAVMMSIRNGVLCDGACICLESPESEELQVYALDFPDEADLQERTTIPLSGTIAGHVFQTAKPWSGSREEACAHFPRQLLLAPGFASGCMLPIPGRHPVLGTLGLVRRDNNSFSEDEIDFLTQVSTQIGIAVENALAYQQIRELREKLAQESLYVQDDIRDETNFEEIVGKSPCVASWSK